MASSNSLNISQKGVVYFNGVTTFSGLDGSTSGKVLTSNGTGIAPSFQTITTGITLTGDSGTATGSSLTLFTNASTINAGSTIKFVNSGTTSTLNTTDGVANTLIGHNCGNATLTGIANTGLGQATLISLTSGIQNTAIGNGALLSVSSGVANTAIGYLAGQLITTSSENCIFGWGAMTNAFGVNRCEAMGTSALNFCTGNDNAAFGYHAGTTISSGTQNTALGNYAINVLSTGTNNVAIGYGAGSNYTSSESNNIVISSAISGVIGESNVVRIGTNQTTCFIQGINGATVTGTSVLCSTAGQLGTVVSSERYKENIVDMPDNVSIMNLRPVRFNYKEDIFKTISYGLIAEEVEKDFPYLCFYKDGQPESVKYHELCVFLLAEVQRLEKRVNVLETK